MSFEKEYRESMFKSFRRALERGKREREEKGEWGRVREKKGWGNNGLFKLTYAEFIY